MVKKDGDQSVMSDAPVAQIRLVRGSAALFWA